MSLFVSSHLIIDTDFLICAHPVQGNGPADGCYAIALIVSIGEHVKRIYADFPTVETRDAAFDALAVSIQHEQLRAEERDSYDLD